MESGRDIAADCPGVVIQLTKIDSTPRGFILPFLCNDVQEKCFVSFVPVLFNPLESLLPDSF